LPPPISGWEAANRLPLGRRVDPEEAARAVNFLVSDDVGLMTAAIVNFDQTVGRCGGGNAGARGTGAADELKKLPTPPTL
jgi:hypothetical protein